MNKDGEMREKLGKNAFLVVLFVYFDICMDK